MSDPNENAADVQAIRKVLCKAIVSRNLPFFKELSWVLPGSVQAADAKLHVGYLDEEAVYASFHTRSGYRISNWVRYTHQSNAKGLRRTELNKISWEIPYRYIMAEPRSDNFNLDVLCVFIKASFILKGLTENVPFETNPFFLRLLRRVAIQLEKVKDQGNNTRHADEGVYSPPDSVNTTTSSNRDTNRVRLPKNKVYVAHCGAASSPSEPSSTLNPSLLGKQKGNSFTPVVDKTQEDAGFQLYSATIGHVSRHAPSDVGHISPSQPHFDRLIHGHSKSRRTTKAGQPRSRASSESGQEAEGSTFEYELDDPMTSPARHSWTAINMRPIAGAQAGKGMLARATNASSHQQTATHVNSNSKVATAASSKGNSNIICSGATPGNSIILDPAQKGPENEERHADTQTQAIDSPEPTGDQDLSAGSSEGLNHRAADETIISGPEPDGDIEMRDGENTGVERQVQDWFHMQTLIEESISRITTCEAKIGHINDELESMRMSSKVSEDKDGIEKKKIAEHMEGYRDQVRKRMEKEMNKTNVMEAEALRAMEAGSNAQQGKINEILRKKAAEEDKIREEEKSIEKNKKRMREIHENGGFELVMALMEESRKRQKQG